jgi:hypothetical protein
MRRDCVLHPEHCARGGIAFVGTSQWQHSPRSRKRYFAPNLSLPGASNLNVLRASESRGTANLVGNSVIARAHTGAVSLAVAAVE